MANEFVTRRGIISLGGVSFPYYSTITAYTVTDDDYFVDCLSGTFSVALPNSTITTAGKIFIIKNSGAGLITVDPNNSETIDGSGTKTLSQNQSICIINKNPNWTSFSGGISGSGSGTSGTSGYSGIDGVVGSGRLVTKTSSYTITTGDQIIIADAASGEINITLPTAVGSTGTYYTVKRINTSNSVTIVTTSSQLIDGGSTVVLSTQYQSVTVVSNGSNWFII